MNGVYVRRTVPSFSLEMRQILEQWHPFWIGLTRVQASGSTCGFSIMYYCKSKGEERISDYPS
jgi:hypothetical protein